MLLLSCITDNANVPGSAYDLSKAERKSQPGKFKRPDSDMPRPKPDQYIDPRFQVKSHADGLSDSPSGEGITEQGVPPLAMIGGEVGLDPDAHNLGRNQLTTAGPAIKRLLEWSEQTDWPRQAIIQLDEAYKAGKLGNGEVAKVYKLLSEGTFGSEVFQYYLDAYGSDPGTFYRDHIRKNKGADATEMATRERTEFLGSEDQAEAQRSLGLLKKHGPALSALMDFIDALMHVSDQSTVTVKAGRGKNAPAREIKTYGQFHSGNSGVGGGGEIMLSVKFAYHATKENLGSQEGTDRFHAAVPGHDPQKQKAYDLIRKTGPGATDPEMASLDEGAVPDMIRPKIMANLTFWVGMSSSLPVESSVRRPHMATLWPKRGLQGKRWGEARDYFNIRNPSLAEDTGEVINSAGLNLNRLEKRIIESFEKVRQDLSLESILIKSTTQGDIVLGNELSIAAREQQPDIPEATTPTPTAPIDPTIDPADQITDQVEQPAGTTPGVDPNALLPNEDKNPSKPMFQAPQSGFIGKNKNKRTLIKSKNRLNADTLVQRLTRVASQFDQRGEKELADVFDSLLIFITKEKTNSRENRK